jgi:uncharacterized damage-inducible protein DinB
MSEVATIWHFTRRRLAQAIEGLSNAQLNWRLFEGAHSIAEYLYHVAGVELYWAHHLGSWQPADDFEAGVLLQCTCDSFLNEKPFPLPQSRAATQRMLDARYNWHTNDSAPIIESPTPEQLAKPVRSPIGDPIDGREGLIRVAQHAAYHTGQIWLIRMYPQFPDR